jgi:hypothetical protein
LVEAARHGLVKGRRKAAVYEKTCRISHSTRERVRGIGRNHADAIDRLVVMDNVPTRIVARDFNAKVARAYWFFLFHLVPDLPEALITGREAI